MRYFIAFDKESFEGSIVCHGCGPDNEEGFISRANGVLSELVFEDFESFKAALNERNINIFFDPIALQAEEANNSNSEA